MCDMASEQWCDDVELAGLHRVARRGLQIALRLDLSKLTRVAVFMMADL